jgi:glucose-6-phosphate 1-dehydrogenase
MAKKSTEIVIQFRRPPHVMFPMAENQSIAPNILAICLQPDEGIHFRFEAKVPDSVTKMKSVDMDFHYVDSFTESAIPDAYERLLLDAIHGDASLFTRSDQIEMGWQLVDPIIRGWLDSDTQPLSFYKPGGWGPIESDQLLNREAREWLQVCGRHS